jgi:hypothetical protein
MKLPAVNSLGVHQRRGIWLRSFLEWDSLPCAISAAAGFERARL